MKRGKDQNPDSRPSLPRSSDHEGDEPGVNKLCIEHMDDFPYEANQLSIHGSPNSRTVECTNDSNKSIFAFLHTKTGQPAVGGASFCASLRRTQSVEEPFLNPNKSKPPLEML